MTISDEQYTAWLDDPSNVGCTLLEVQVYSSGSEQTRYLSTRPYTSEGTVSPVAYLPVVKSGVKFTEELSLTAEASLSASDIEIDNSDGSLDPWLEDVWVNRSIQAFLGDPSWDRADFRQIFSGAIAGISPNGRDTLALKLRDKLQRLNTPTTEAKLGGATANKDKLLPVTLGECHNIGSLLSDPTMLEYTYHTGAAEGVFEVRDNGKPVGFTQTAGTGKFRLAANPADGITSGGITASVQGDKPSSYQNTVAQLVARLATGFGKLADRFTNDDLDLTNLADFEATHPQPVGLYLPDRTNILVACQELAASLGAQIVMSRAGKLRLFQINLPPVGTPTDIGPADMQLNTLVVSEVLDVKASVKLAFCKNYTVQGGLLTTIPEEHKDLFSKEWLTETVEDSATKSLYHLDAEPIQEETALLVRSDAQTEATRRLNIFKVPRKIYQFEGLPRLLMLQLGDAVTLTHWRFGLQAGKLGLVISLAPDWKTRRVTVKVLA